MIYRHVPVPLWGSPGRACARGAARATPDWPASRLSVVCAPGVWPGLKASVHRAVRLGALQGHAAGTAKSIGGWSGQRHLHIFVPDRAADIAAGLVLAEAVRRVEADPAAGDDAGGEADEPGIVEIIGGAGFAGDRLGDALHGRRAGAAQDDALHHGDDLEHANPGRPAARRKGRAAAAGRGRR